MLIMKYFFLIIFGLFPFIGESQSQTTFTAETVEGVVLSYIVTAEDQVSVSYGDDMNLAGTVTYRQRSSIKDVNMLW